MEGLLQARLTLLNDHSDRISLELDGCLIRDSVPDVGVAESSPAYNDLAED
jgi:hypothetical protein